MELDIEMVFFPYKCLYMGSRVDLQRPTAVSHVAVTMMLREISGP